MSDQDAVEHNRQAQEHDPHERDRDAPDALGGPDPLNPDNPDEDADDSRTGRPGPAGDTHLGGGLTGGS
jgi:hypothetical protein